MKTYKIILILVLIILPFFAFALENQYEGFDPSEGTSNLFVFFVKLAISAGVIISILVIMYHGANMIMAQGEMAKIIIAKERIFAVFIGLLVLLGVYVIAITINPDLVIMNIDPLDPIERFIDNIGGNNKNANQIEFEEIPLGTIVESILAANSSKRIEGVQDNTGEQCYTYDENGDTIDLNGDGQITPEEDTLRGVDMFYCIDQLNQATIKKIKALNTDYLCRGEKEEGPMRKIINLIKSRDEEGNYNCSCDNCSNYSYLSLPTDWNWLTGCKTVQTTCCSYDAEGNETCTPGLDACDNHCGDSLKHCCGSAYYNPNIGCQTSTFLQAIKHDPCGQDTRDKIDCTRNEIKIRIDGKSYDDLPPGAQANNCSFTNFWENSQRDPEKFLTLELALKRMELFENYYKNHLNDLDRAVSKMRQYGEKLSMAEFQNLKTKNNQDKEVIAVAFQGNGNYTYDPIKYCKEFNCTNYNPINSKDDKKDDVCISGIRDELTDALYQKEQPFQEYDSTTDTFIDFKDRRICKVEDLKDKEEYSYSGDGATFYYRKDFEYEKIDEKETLRMVTDKGELEYMESEIPLGEVVNDARKFTEKLLEFTKEIKEEVNNVKINAEKFASLPEDCDCSLNCSTHPTSGNSEQDSCSSQTCGQNRCDNCSTCESDSKGTCVCCEDCETSYGYDSFFYGCVIDHDSSIIFFGNDANDWYINANFYNTIPDRTNNQCFIWSDDKYGASYSTQYVAAHSFYTNCACFNPRNSETLYQISPNVDPKIYLCSIFTSTANRGSCACMLREDMDENDHNCYNPQTGQKLSFTKEQFMSHNGFSSSSAIYIYLNSVMPSLITEIKELPSSITSWDVASCQNVSGGPIYPYYDNIFPQSILKLEPRRNYNITYITCDGEESTDALLSNEDKETIEQFISMPIEWIEGRNAFKAKQGDLIPCSSVYSGAEDYWQGNLRTSMERFVPSGFTGRIVIENGLQMIEINKIKNVSSSTIDLSGRGKPNDEPIDYYVCPYNELKDKQCRIFKYSSAFENSAIYPEDQESGLSCTDPNSSGIGHLQKIELLSKRIIDYGDGRNLKPGDPDRWTVLDVLNLSREKLDKCVTGYGLPLKQGAKSYTLLSCEEGLNSLAFGSFTILPSFPYPPSSAMWNCQPYNNMDYLVPEDRLNCLHNKQHPDCTGKINNLLDDYYCLQREE